MLDITFLEMQADCKESEIRMHKSVENDFKIGELLNPLEKKIIARVFSSVLSDLCLKNNNNKLTQGEDSRSLFSLFTDEKDFLFLHHTAQSYFYSNIAKTLIFLNRDKNTIQVIIF